MRFRPAVVSSCAIGSPRWSATDSWPVLPIVGKRAVLDRLSRRWSFASNASRGRLPVVQCIGERGKRFCRKCGALHQAVVQARGATAYPGEGRFELQSFVASSRSPHSEHSLVNEGNHRDPKQSRTLGEQFLCNTDAFIRAK